MSVVTILLFSISLGFICFWEHEPWNHSQLVSTHQDINLQSWRSLADQNLVFWGTAIPSTAKALWVVWEVMLQPCFSHLWEVSGWGSVQETGWEAQCWLGSGQHWPCFGFPGHLRCLVLCKMSAAPCNRVHVFVCCWLLLGCNHTSPQAYSCVLEVLIFMMNMLKCLDSPRGSFCGHLGHLVFKLRVSGTCAIQTFQLCPLLLSAWISWLGG